MPAAHGRALQDGVEDVPSSSVAVIGDALWRKHFGADPNIAGQVITLRARPFEVVGVAPDWFRGLWVGFRGSVWQRP